MPMRRYDDEWPGLSPMVTASSATAVPDVERDDAGDDAASRNAIGFSFFEGRTVKGGTGPTVRFYRFLRCWVLRCVDTVQSSRRGGPMGLTRRRPAVASDHGKEPGSGRRRIGCRRRYPRLAL